MEWDTSTDYIFADAFPNSFCPQACGVNGVDIGDLHEELADSALTSENSVHCASKSPSNPGGERDISLPLPVSYSKVTRDGRKKPSNRIEKKRCQVPAYKLLAPKADKKDIPHLRSSFERPLTEAPLIYEPQPVKEYARWTRVQGTNKIFVEGCQWRTRQHQQEARTPYDRIASSIPDSSEAGDIILRESRDNASGSLFQSQKASSTKSENRSCSACYFQKNACVRDKNGLHARCLGCEKLFKKNLESIVSNPAVYLSLGQLCFANITTFVDLVKLVQVEIRNAYKEDVSVPHGTAPCPTVCYLNAAPIPQQFSDTSDPVIMPPWTAEDGLEAPLSAHNNVHMKNFMDNRLVDFLEDKTIPIDPALMGPALKCAGLFVTLFSLKDIKVYKEGHVNDFEAKRLIYWMLLTLLKQCLAHLDEFCRAVNDPGSDSEEVMCAIFLCWRVASKRKNIKMATGCLRSLATYMEQDEQRRSYLQKRFECAMGHHAALNCNPRGRFSAQRRKLILDHSELQSPLTLTYSHECNGSIMLPKGFSEGRSIIEVLSRHRPVPGRDHLSGLNSQKNCALDYLVLPMSSEEAPLPSEVPPLTNGSALMSKHDDFSNLYDHVWQTGYSVMGIEQPVTSHQLELLSDLKGMASAPLDWQAPTFDGTPDFNWDLDLDLDFEVKRQKEMIIGTSNSVQYSDWMIGQPHDGEIMVPHFPSWPDQIGEKFGV